jgi:hypothetical protein
MGRRWRFWEDFSQEMVPQELRINFKLFWRPRSGEADKIEIIETSIKSPKIPPPEIFSTKPKLAKQIYMQF